jgi:hypothetical protein
VKYLSFCAWLISSHIMTSSCICVVTNNWVLFPFIYESYPVVYTPHIFFILHPISWLLWIVLQWTGRCRCLWQTDFITFDYIPSGGTFGLHRSSSFNF